MVEIYLANEKGVAVIDDDDAQWIPMAGWYLHGGGYAAHQPMMIDGLTYSLLHRLVLKAQRGTEIDHVNHVKLDCRKSNLRFVNRSQNNQNRQKSTYRGKSGYRGVSIQYNKGGTVSYYACVRLNKRPIYRCGFRTAEEAAIAAAELRRTYYTHSKEWD